MRRFSVVLMSAVVAVVGSPGAESAMAAVKTVKPGVRVTMDHQSLPGRPAFPKFRFAFNAPRGGLTTTVRTRPSYTTVSFTKSPGACAKPEQANTLFDSTAVMSDVQGATIDAALDNTKLFGGTSEIARGAGKGDTRWVVHAAKGRGFYVAVLSASLAIPNADGTSRYVGLVIDGGPCFPRNEVIKLLRGASLTPR